MELRHSAASLYMLCSFLRMLNVIAYVFRTPSPAAPPSNCLGSCTSVTNVDSYFAVAADWPLQVTRGSHPLFFPAHCRTFCLPSWFFELFLSFSSHRDGL
jgi:hypothetical protein